LTVISTYIAERKGDLALASQLLYERIPQLEQQLPAERDGDSDEQFASSGEMTAEDALNDDRFGSFLG
jgi:hypothetical protein